MQCKRAIYVVIKVKNDLQFETDEALIYVSSSLFVPIFPVYVGKKPNTFLWGKKAI